MLWLFISVAVIGHLFGRGLKNKLALLLAVFMTWGASISISIFIMGLGGDVPPEVVTQLHTKPWILMTALFLAFASVGSGWRRRKTLEKSKELAAKTEEMNS